MRNIVVPNMTVVCVTGWAMACAAVMACEKNSPEDIYGR